MIKPAFSYKQIYSTLILAFIALTGFSQTKSLQPTADARVYQSQATENFGYKDLAVKIQSGNKVNRDSYLKFDISGLQNQELKKVTLKLYCSKIEKAVPATISILAVTDNDWQQKTITWDNKPELEKEIASAIVDKAGSFHEWDITEYVKSLNFKGKKQYFSIALTDLAKSANLVTFHSKESDDNQPALIIEQ